MISGFLKILNGYFTEGVSIVKRPYLCDVFISLTFDLITALKREWILQSFFYYDKLVFLGKAPRKCTAGTKQ